MLFNRLFNSFWIIRCLGAPNEVALFGLEPYKILTFTYHLKCILFKNITQIQFPSKTSVHVYAVCFLRQPVIFGYDVFNTLLLFPHSFWANLYVSILLANSLFCCFIVKKVRKNI